MPKLNLGCNDRKIHGFINIDSREEVGPDLVGDVTNLDTMRIDNSSVDLIYASHILEHFDFETSENILKHWYKKLKKGGVLRLAVPDIGAVCSYYLKTKDLQILSSFFWGGQNYDTDYHLCGWDFTSIEKTLSSIGFTSIGRYDWRDTEHYYVDDYSQAYLPHMDKDKGVLLSLNVEAVK